MLHRKGYRHTIAAKDVQSSRLSDRAIPRRIANRMTILRKNVTIKNKMAMVISGEWFDGVTGESFVGGGALMMNEVRA